MREPIWPDYEHVPFSCTNAIFAYKKKNKLILATMVRLAVNKEYEYIFNIEFPEIDHKYLFDSPGVLCKAPSILKSENMHEKIEAISKRLKLKNKSVTIRYCVRKYYNIMEWGLMP